MAASYCVGIDVALHAHRIGVLGPNGEAVGPSFTIEATREGFTELVQTLRARGAVPAAPLVGLEATGHYGENLEASLGQAGYRVLLLNALQTRRYRDVLRRKAKTDDIDAYVVAGLLRSGSAEGCFVPNDQIQSLRELARLRARLMRERQDYLRQFVGQLDVVFPEHRTALGDVSTVRARGLLAAFPTAHHLAQATPAALRRVARRGFSLQDATTLRNQARGSAYSGKAAHARGQVVRTLLSQYERLTPAIDELDEAVEALLPPTAATGDPSDAALRQTLPGVGPHTAGTLLGELGSFTRFANARALVAYVGFYPVISQSGERSAIPYVSPVGSRIARHVLYLAAVNAVRRSAEWRALYRRKTAQGKTAKQALIVVAVKWLHAAYAMLTHREPYHPMRFAGVSTASST